MEYESFTTKFNASDYAQFKSLCSAMGTRPSIVFRDVINEAIRSHKAGDNNSLKDLVNFTEVGFEGNRNLLNHNAFICENVFPSFPEMEIHERLNQNKHSDFEVTDDEVDAYIGTDKFKKELGYSYSTVLDLLSTLQDFIILTWKNRYYGEMQEIALALAKVRKDNTTLYGQEDAGFNDPQHLVDWAGGVDSRLDDLEKEGVRPLKKELDCFKVELEALKQGLFKRMPLESDNTPYKQRLVYNHTPKYEWEGHAFRSKQEMEVAVALDALGVVYGPNVGVRVTEGEIRKTREVDFMVYLDGHTGILECDSVEFHNAENDIERDRNFQRQGIYFIKRYTSKECLDPNWVAEDFIKSMRFFYAK